MDQALPIAKDIANKVYAKYQSLDNHPALTKFNINNILKPSNIALLLTGILALIVLIVSPLGIPFIIVCFVLPLRATLRAFKSWEEYEWIILYWVFNAFIEVLSPFLLFFIPFEFLLTLLRIAAAYYIVVMEGGRQLYPMVK